VCRSSSCMSLLAGVLSSLRPSSYSQIRCQIVTPGPLLECPLGVLESRIVADMRPLSHCERWPVYPACPLTTTLGFRGRASVPEETSMTGVQLRLVGCRMSPQDPGRIVCVDPRQDVGRSCQNLLRSCQESSGQDGVARSGQDGVVRTQWGIVWMA
jgi:hypothetical protein